MKRILVILTMLLFSTTFWGQNLDKMNEADREAYLIAKTKEYTMKYGPAYYREYKTPIINRANMPERGIPTGKNQNRPFYYVSLLYDLDKELFVNNDAVYIRIWADTGTVFSITFGNNITYYFDDNSNKMKSTQEYPVVPYEAITGVELEKMKKERVKTIVIEDVKKE